MAGPALIFYERYQNLGLLLTHLKRFLKQREYQPKKITGILCYELPLFQLFFLRSIKGHIMSLWYFKSKHNKQMTNFLETIVLDVPETIQITRKAFFQFVKEVKTRCLFF